MNKTTLILGTFFGAFAASWAATNELANPPPPPPPSAFYSNVTNLWKQGQHTNVLALANARLASNTNDIGGLILKAAYDYAYSDKSTLSNSLVRVVRVGKRIHSPNFTPAFIFGCMDIKSILDTLATETDEEHAADILKLQGPHHSFPFSIMLRALDRDRHFGE